MHFKLAAYLDPNAKKFLSSEEIKTAEEYIMKKYPPKSNLFIF